MSYRDRLRSTKKPEEDTSGSTATQCCETPSIEPRDGDAVCVNCGMILGRNLVGNERRAYTVEEVNKSPKLTQKED